MKEIIELLKLAEGETEKIHFDKLKEKQNGSCRN